MQYGIAEAMEAAELERVKDPKDKLVNRLYQKKTEELLAQEGRSLSRCAFCGKVYHPSHVRPSRRSSLPCPV